MPIIADALSSQPWAYLGTDETYLDQSVKASECKKVMVERATSLLLAQIERLQCRAFGRDDHKLREARFRGILEPSVKSSLLEYVQTIADNYHGVHYHSFQHGMHVMLGVNNLMNHVAASNVVSSPSYGSFASTITMNSTDNAEYPNEESCIEIEREVEAIEIFGPITHFTVIFAAMIHDVDHFGVPNDVLIKEQHPYAVKYKNESVAEQNSSEFALQALDEARFASLRRIIFASEAEYIKFQEAVREIVLTTDIANSERQDLCKQRFKDVFPSKSNELKTPKFTKVTKDIHGGSTQKTTKAKSSDDSSWPNLLTKCAVPLFSRLRRMKRSRQLRSSNTCFNQRLSNEHKSCSQEQNFELRRLRVMEHIILAADVSHCMQSWEVFLKWNAKLYNEFQFAFDQGRSFDPSANWYNGQIDFFDKYIIPLTLRLEESGLVGAFGSTLVNLSRENKQKWLVEGEAISSVLRGKVIEDVDQDCPANHLC